MMVKFGCICYTGCVLIRHLREHDVDILFTSAFKMAEFYRSIQICLHGTSKKAYFSHRFYFLEDNQFNQSIHEYLLCSENVP